MSSPDTPGARSTAIAVDLRQLRYFLAVAEELHFGHAAERLHIAQPPLSQAIRKLEQELGVQLLHRTSRVVALTDAGSTLSVEARKVLASFEVAVTETRRAGGADTPLRVGCLPDLPIERLLRLMDALKTHDPPVDVRVANLPPADQLAQLRAARLDLAIVHAPGTQAGLESEVLFEGEPLALFLAPEHPLAGRPVLGPEELADEPLVTFPRSADPALHDHLAAVLDDAGYRFACVAEAPGLHVRDLLFAVADRAGVAIAQSSLIDVTSAGSLVVRRQLDPQPRSLETVLVWNALPPGRLGSSLGAVRAAVRDLRSH